MLGERSTRYTAVWSHLLKKSLMEKSLIFLCSATNHNFLLIHSKYWKLRNGKTWYSSFPQFYIVWKKNYYSTFLNLFQRIQRLERCSKALHHFLCSEVCCINYEQDFVHRLKNEIFHSGNFKSGYMYYFL